MVFSQCRTVKISILGDEGVPVQVDGEAWVQPPGYIRIIHKNRAQTLTRDRVRRAACGDPEGRPGAHLQAHLCTSCQETWSFQCFVLGICFFQTQRLSEQGCNFRDDSPSSV